MLELCQGNCGESYIHCREGLVCFQRTEESVPGCIGSPTSNYHYCIYPELVVATTAVNTLNNNGAFLRVQDNGSLTVFTDGGSTVIWDANNNKTQTGMDFDPEFDISPQMANQMHFTGTYRHSEIQFDFDSDARKGGFHAGDNDAYIEVYSTISITYRLTASYPVSIHSRISFDITLGSEIEAIAICVDNGIDVFEENTERVLTKCLAFGGTAIAATFGTKIETLDSLAEPGITMSVDFALATLFPSRSSDIYYIGIMQVASAGSTIDDTLPSRIENIYFYDQTITSGRRFLITGGPDPCEVSLASTIGSPCAPGCMVATTKEGLYHEIQREGDFCTAVDNVLTQIKKNEEEPCLLSRECRSGICQDKKCHSRVSLVYKILTIYKP